jgi:type I restriction enzyme R subunit
MSAKEAQARVKINKLLEAAGWRFFDDVQGRANIAPEPNVKLSQQQVDAMGADFETSSNGFIDFLLLDDKGFPLVVLEAGCGEKAPKRMDEHTGNPCLLHLELPLW